MKPVIIVGKQAAQFLMNLQKMHKKKLGLAF